MVNNERNRLAIDCIPSQEDITTKQSFPGPLIRDALVFEVRMVPRLSVEVIGAYDNHNYFQITAYFIFIWNQMCKAFGSPEGQLQDSLPKEAPPEEREVWKRILARAPFD